MISQNCPVVSQNMQIFIETVVDCCFIYNLKIGGLSKLLDGSSSHS